MHNEGVMTKKTEENKVGQEDIRQEGGQEERRNDAVKEQQGYKGENECALKDYDIFLFPFGVFLINLHLLQSNKFILLCMLHRHLTSRFIFLQRQ